VRRLAAALLLGAAATAVACSGGSGTDAGDTTTSAAPASTTTTAPATTSSTAPLQLNDAAIKLTKIAQVQSPTAFSPRSGDSSLYLTEQVGRVRRIRVNDDGKGHVSYQLEGTPLLDISRDVTAGGEQGLLGITFSPDGRRLYVAYTERDGRQRVDEFQMNDTRVDTRSRRKIFEVDDFAPNHNGGQLAFGPDGFLYYSMGDGGGAGDPQKNGQKTTDLLGDLLRVDPEGGDPYGIPDGNPFKDGQGGAPEVYAYGLRNPWRFSFDKGTGDLWIADVGQGNWEEIDYRPSGEGAGANFGWSDFEGNHPFNANKPPAGAIPPLLEYDHSNGRCAVIGGYVYRGTRIPKLTGAYLYSDACEGTINALVQQDGKVVAQRSMNVHADSPSSFGQDASGELYVVSLGGPIYRVDPA
jgi:glucose/arabinose dehydrogenase